MAYCPNIKDPNVLQDFNRVIRLFDGKPMTLNEFKSVEERDLRTGNDKVAMNVAYSIWNLTEGNVKGLSKDVVEKTILDDYNGRESLFNQGTFSKESDNIFFNLSNESELVSKSLEDKLTNFLTDMGFNIEELDSLQERTGYSILGATDLLTKTLIYNKDSKQAAIPKEAAYIIFELLGKKNIIRKDLIASIHLLNDYNDRLSKYQFSKLSEYKKRELIVIDFLHEQLIENFNYPLNLKKEYKSIDASAKNNLQYALLKFRQFWNNLLRKFFKNYKREEIKNIINQIAQDVLDRNYRLFATDLKQTIEPINPDIVLKDNPVMNEIFTNLKQLGFIPSGSYALAKQGTIFRTKFKDLDFTIPYDKFKDGKYLEEIKKLYPDVKINKSYEGIYNFSLTQTIQINGVDVDLFLQITPDEVFYLTEDGVQDWFSIFDAKIRIGSKKHINDLLNWSPLDKYSIPLNKLEDYRKLLSLEEELKTKIQSLSIKFSPDNFSKNSQLNLLWERLKSIQDKIINFTKTPNFRRGLRHFNFDWIKSNFNKQFETKDKINQNSTLETTKEFSYPEELVEKAITFLTEEGLYDGNTVLEYTGEKSFHFKKLLEFHKGNFKNALVDFYKTFSEDFRAYYGNISGRIPKSAKAFKFGNPEYYNKPSIFVNKDGSPSILYHGAGTSFDTFNKDYFLAGEGMMAFGAGFYGTTYEPTADNYAKTSKALKEKIKQLILEEDSKVMNILQTLGGYTSITEAFLDALTSNLLMGSQTPFDDVDYGKYESLRDLLGLHETKYLYIHLVNPLQWNDKIRPEIRSLIESKFNIITETTSSEGDLYRELQQKLNISDVELSARLYQIGIDGTTHYTGGGMAQGGFKHEKGELHYVIFEPIQAKAVNNSGLFDKNNANMYDPTTKTANTKGVNFLQSEIGNRNLEQESLPEFILTKEEQLTDLNKRLIAFMESIGGTVEVHDFIKTKLGNNAEAVAILYDKVIKITKQGLNNAVLPEEVGHIALGTLKDTQVVRWLMNYVKTLPEFSDMLVNGYAAEYRNEDGTTNEDKLAFELAGKMLANHIKKLAVQEGRLGKILNKIWSDFKRIINKLTGNEVQNIAERTLDHIAKSIYENRTEIFGDSNLTFESNSEFYSLEEALSTKKKDLEKLLIGLDKRLRIFKAKFGTKKIRNSNEDRLLQRTIDAYEKTKYKEAIVDFTSGIVDKSKLLDKRLDQFMVSVKEESFNPLELAKTLRDIKTYVDSYSDSVRSLHDSLRLDSKFKDDSEVQDYLKLLNVITNQIDRFDSIYHEYGMIVYGKSLQPFVGGNTDLDIIKNLTEVDKDLSIFQRWLNSMAENNSDILKLANQMVNDHKEIVRLEVIAIKQELLEINEELLANGLETDAIWERKAGKLTGYFINHPKLFLQRDWRAAKKAKQQFIKDLVNEMKHNITLREGETLPESYYDLKQLVSKDIIWGKNFKIRLAKWIEANYEAKPQVEIDKIINKKKEEVLLGEISQEEYDDWYNSVYSKPYKGVRKPKGELLMPNALYKTDTSAYDALNPIQQRQLDRVLDLKQQLDSYLPVHRRPSILLSPQIRKDMWERIREDEGGRLQSFGQEMKEMVTVKEDESERGQYKGLTDVKNKPVGIVPFYFTTKLEKVENLSTDFVEVMTRYADSAINYREMNKLVATLEIGKDVIAGTKVVKEGKVQIAVKTLGKLFNLEIKENVELGAAKNALERYTDFLNMQVYGELNKDQGAIGSTNLDYAKTLDLFGRYTAINDLALNIYSGVSNIIQGSAMITQEAFAGEYLDPTDLREAGKRYTLDLPEYMVNIGTINNKSKLHLWTQWTNALQDYESDLHGINSNAGSRFGKLFSVSILFFMSQAGEHLMQLQTSLALANKIKLKDKEGNIYNLYDAMEVVGNKLVMKEGLVKEDGSEFTDKDLIKLTNKTTFVNQRLHGIYNVRDRSALQQYAEGRLLLMYRKFIKPGFDRRYSTKAYNYMGDAWTEGYYTTTYEQGKNFFRRLKEEIREQQITGWYEKLLMARNVMRGLKNELQPHEKANLIRMQVELAMGVGLAILISLISNLMLDGDEDDEWWKVFMAYQARRAYTELAFYRSPEEALMILKSPAAALNKAQALIDVGAMFIPWNAYEWDEENDEIDFTLNNEDRKGQTIVSKNVKGVIPLVRTVEGWFTPDEKLEIYSR